MYGYIDLIAPNRLYTLKSGVTSLGAVWRELKGMANCGIIRLSDNKIIYQRGQ